MMLLLYTVLFLLSQSVEDGLEATHLLGMGGGQVVVFVGICGTDAEELGMGTIAGLYLGAPRDDGRTAGG